VANRLNLLFILNLSKRYVKEQLRNEEKNVSKCASV